MTTNTHEEPDHVDLKSLDIAEDKRLELLQLFPESQTEGGKIDFDRLKLALGEIVDVGRERYGMNWPGKAECFRAVQTPSMATLRLQKDLSVNWKAAESLIVEGDNLEVLKLLQKAYVGRVKMIYIDPPYNTGNDFIYPDNYSESLQTYLEYTAQVDAHGKKFGTNADTDGRFHSKWLNMMYPRLSLARNLLAEDGAIFISIDDNEVRNLRAICDEIYGEDNFIATIIWQKYFSPKSTARHLSTDHDYIVLYARNSSKWSPSLLARTEEADARYTNPDSDARGSWTSAPMQARNYYSQGLYEVTSPTGRKHVPPTGTYWRISEANFLRLNAEGRIWWGDDGNNVPRMKRYLTEVKQGIVPRTFWPYQDVGHTQEAKKELMESVGFENSDNVLDSVKPTRLVQRMLQIATEADGADIVMDFFAGSGVTGHAVINQNHIDGGNRRFVLVQLPERLPSPESQLKTIADITRRRVSHAIEAQRTSDTLPIDSQQDDGFRAFTLSDSNFVPWEAGDMFGPRELEQQLDLHVHHVRPGRSAEDLLFEILLKEGYSPNVVVEAKTLHAKSLYSVADAMLLVCLERGLTLDVIRAIADLTPQRVVCLDDAFEGNDQLKANAVQIFRSRNIVFRTV